MLLLAASLGFKAHGSFADLSEEARYQLAMCDAKTASPAEISTKLTAIVPWNNKIIWNEDKTKILVVSYMSVGILQHYLNLNDLEQIENKTKKGELNATISEVKFELNKEDLKAFNGAWGVNEKNVKKSMEVRKKDKVTQELPYFLHRIRKRDVAWVSAVPEVQFFSYK